MWIFIWLVLSLIILGIFGWSFVILLQQKKCWATYAKRHKLEWAPGKTLESGTVRGTIDGIRISITSRAQQTADVRGERFMSVLEFEMGSGMPTGAAIGTSGMRSFIETLSFQYPYVPTHEKWTGGYICKTRDLQAFAIWFTPVRVNAMLDLFSMRNATVLFFFDELDCVLHVETSDPLRNVDRLERIIHRLLSNIRKLAPEGQMELRPQAEPPAQPADLLLEPTNVLTAPAEPEPVIMDTLPPVVEDAPAPVPPAPVPPVVVPPAPENAAPLPILDDQTSRLLEDQRLKAGLIDKNGV